MLGEYQRVQPSLAKHIVDEIDKGIGERNRHRLDYEKREETRKDRGQWAGILSGIFGVSLAASINYVTGNTILPIVIAVICVGGPNVATIAARFLDKLK